MEAANQPLQEYGIALVVEGGGMRGIFAAGVLDAFSHTGFNPFSLYLGVSAGAMNLLSFLSGQQGRNRDVYRFCAESDRFISLRNFLRGGHYLDLDWMWENTIAAYPLDQDAIFAFLNRHRRRFFVVCSDLPTGKPVYLEPESGKLQGLLTASSAVPVLYRDGIPFAGWHLIDGGATDPIPVRTAYQMGARHIVVIRTRHIGYRKHYGLEARLGAWTYRKQPVAVQMIKEQFLRYNESVEFIRNPPPDVNVIQIAPHAPLQSGRATRNWSALQADYDLGYEKGIEIVQLMAHALQQKVRDLQTIVDAMPGGTLD